METIHNSIEPLLNEHDVARLLDLSVASIRRWRYLKVVPKYLKISASVKYPPDSVRAFIATRPAGGGSSAEAK